MVKKYAFECIIPQLQSLRYCGYYQLDPQSPKIYKFLHKIYMRLCLIWISVFSVQEVIKMYAVRDDKEKLISILFLFLTHTDSIYKQSVFWLKEDIIQELLEIMKGPIYNQDQPEHEAFFKTVTRHGHLILRIGNIMALLTCFLWALLPTIRHWQNQIIEFAFWVPFDYNKNPQFYLVTFYQWTTESWQAFGNTTMDTFIAFLLAQCKTQLRILRTELQILIQRSKLEVQLTNKSFEKVMARRFKMLLEHHDVILNFAKNIENIFSGVIFYQFLVGGWIICTSVYKMANLDPASVEFMSMISYMYCILVEIFVYCYYGSEVTNESKMLLGAIYSMNWLEIQPKFRKNIIILMERVKRPIQPLAGNIIPLSNVTFVRVIKSSYSFFALLTATNE